MSDAVMPSMNHLKKKRKDKKRKRRRYMNLVLQSPIADCKREFFNENINKLISCL